MLASLASPADPIKGAKGGLPGLAGAATNLGPAGAAACQLLYLTLAASSPQSRRTPLAALRAHQPRDAGVMFRVAALVSLMHLPIIRLLGEPATVRGEKVQ